MIDSGQQTRVFLAIESQPFEILLTEEQLSALEDLSKELSGAKSYWKFSDDEEYLPDSRVIQIMASGRDLYRVKVLNAIGAIALPDLDIFVGPKIPMDHFLFIAKHALLQGRHSSDSSLEMEAGFSFQELVCLWFLESCEAVTRFGLTRAYSETRAKIGFVRGAVNQVSSTRGWLQGRASVDCNFEDFSENNIQNRILKRALQVVFNSNFRSVELRSRAWRSLQHFDSVSELREGDLVGSLRAARDGYGEATFLAHQVMSAQGRSLEHGQSHSKSFLFPTPSLIEEGIRVILERGLAPIKVKKGGRVLTPTFLRVTPDLELARPPFTADVKYKTAGEGWKRGHLEQAVFFATAYGSKQAAVIEFSANPNLRLPTVPVGNVNVSSVTWITSPDWSPEVSAQALVDDFFRWLPVEEREALFRTNQQQQPFLST